MIDRPELVNREGENDNEDNQVKTKRVETLGRGGGPVKNGIEFEQGHFNIVAASNLVAVLATGDTEGEMFEETFVNAAIQLYDQVKRGGDVRDLVRYSVASGVSEIGFSQDEVDQLREQPEDAESTEEVQSEIEDGEVEENVGDEDGVEEEEDNADDEEESSADEETVEDELEEMEDSEDNGKEAA